MPHWVMTYVVYLSSGEPLTVQSPGTQTRSFCYVSDMVCDIFYFLMYCIGVNVWDVHKISLLLKCEG